MAEGDGEDWKGRLKALGLGRKRRPPGPRAAAPVAGGKAAHILRGRAGEDEAARHLEAGGVTILARNVRYPDGELDLVGRHGAALVFVEVKWRRSAERGSAAEAVTSRKRMRIVKAARRWLAENPRTKAREVRFDVVAIDEEAGTVEWLKGAFDAG